MAITPGQQLEEYNIVRQLGQGAFGTVYLAQDTHLDRFVAIKELTVTSQTDGTAFKRFIQEARTAGGLNHPHIVTVHGLKIIKNDIYLVMEYLPGGSLRHQLEQRGQLPVEEAIRIALHTCEGLAAAHAKGIIHRDIKPENILLTEVGQAKIGDFGIAHVPQGTGGTLLTQAGFQPGTVVYMSPEQIRGKPLDGRSDIYQVGILLYELLTGQHYIDLVNIEQRAREAAGSNLMRYQARFFDILDEAICEIVSVSPCRLRTDIPEWLASLILEILNKQFQERPHAGDLAQKLSAGLISSNGSSSASKVVNSAENKRLCPACSYQLSEEAKFCTNCGRRLLRKLKSTISKVSSGSVEKETDSTSNNPPPKVDTSLKTNPINSANDLLFPPDNISVLERANIYFDRGMEFIEQGLVDEGIQELQTTMEIYPDHLDAHYNLGVAYLVQDKLEKAAQEFQVVLSLNPDIAQAHNNLGSIYEQKGYQNEAIREFQIALELQPENVAAHINLGRIYGSRGQVEEAANEFETALMLSPDNPRAHYGLAITYQERGYISDAIDHAQFASLLGFKQADELLYELSKRASTSIHDNTVSLSKTVNEILDEGVRLKREGCYRAAKEAYYRAIQMSPTNVMAYYSLAKVCYLTEEQAESVVNYLRAIHLSLYNQISSLSKDARSRLMFEQQLKEFPSDIVNKCRSIHEYAPLLFLDVNTPAHLAHTLVDLNQGSSKAREVQAYMPVYRTALSGAGGQLDDEFEDSFYHPIGVNFLLAEIRWDKITSTDVLSLYAETKQLLPNKTASSPTMPDNIMLSSSKQNQIDTSLQTTSEQASPGIVLVCFTCGEILGIHGLNGMTSWKCPICGNLISFTGKEIVGMWHPETSGIAKPTILIYEPIKTAAGLGFGNPFGEEAPLCTVVSMIGQAQKLLNEGSPAEAINVLKRVLKIRPNLGGAYTLLGNAYTMQKLLDQAVIMYQKAIDISPQYFLPYHYLGIAYLNLNKLAEAAKEFQQVIALKPDFADGYYNLGLIHFNNQNIALATEHFEKATDLNPEDALSALNLSNCYKMQGHLLDAIQELMRILALYPDFSDAHHNLGSCYMELENVDAAIREYQIAAQINPQDIDTRKALGYAFRMKREFTKAIHEYKTALHLNPDNLEIRYNLGVTYLQQEMGVEAIRELKIVTEQVPDFAEAHFYLGAAYGQQGHLDKATREANVALKLGYSLASQLLTTLQQQRASHKKGWFS